MKAEIISVGTELLLGQIVDTNAAYLAKQLASIGVDLYWVSQVGDNQGRIESLLRTAWDRSDLIIMTGGLGPTQDDLTRESIAGYLGEEMAIDPALEANLRQLTAARGYTLTPNNLKQATLIPSARVIYNPRGSAPGWLVEKDGRTIVAMPGVPNEMYRMWENEAMPVIQQKVGACVIFSRTLKVVGLGESFAEYQIRDLMSSTNPTIAPYAKDDGVHFRLTAKADSIAAAREMVAGLEEKVRRVLGDAVYATDDETPSEAIGKMLHDKGLTVAVMESVSGGYIANQLTLSPYSQEYFCGGFVVANARQAEKLGVSLDATPWVSPEAAQAMAKRARELAGANIGLGVSGIDVESTFDTTLPGTVYAAINMDGISELSRKVYPTLGSEYRQRCLMAAIEVLRKALLSYQPAG